MRLTLSGSRHSILHSLRVSTRPPSGDRSISSGSGSRKSSLSNRSSTRSVGQQKTGNTERGDAPRLDIPSSAIPGTNFLCRFLRLRCRSLLIVAEKTNVLMSSRGGIKSSAECLDVADLKSSV
jgi:hypothetical protein